MNRARNEELERSIRIIAGHAVNPLARARDLQADAAILRGIESKMRNPAAKEKFRGMVASLEAAAMLIERAWT